jgi:hypothetical protein
MDAHAAAAYRGGAAPAAFSPLLLITIRSRGFFGGTLRFSGA